MIRSVFEGRYLSEFEVRQQLPVDAISTGIPGWDRQCRDDGGRQGLGLGWFVTLGGNPGLGKSLAALNIAAAAVRGDRSVGFVSLEMTDKQLSARFYSILTGTPVQRLERGSFAPQAFASVREKIARAQAEGTFAQFYTHDDVIQGLGDVVEAMDAMRASDPPAQLFVVDYMQLVGTGDDESIYRQTTTIANAMRRYAHTHRVTVLGLSQFNRSTSSNYEDSPRPQGLHGGMTLEANSDQVVLLDHSKHKRDPGAPHIARTWLLLAKNRHGGQVKIPVEWNYQTLRLREADPDEEHLWADSP